MQVAQNIIQAVNPNNPQQMVANQANVQAQHGAGAAPLAGQQNANPVAGTPIQMRTVYWISQSYTESTRNAITGIGMGLLISSLLWNDSMSTIATRAIAFFNISGFILASNMCRIAKEMNIPANVQLQQNMNIDNEMCNILEHREYQLLTSPFKNTWTLIPYLFPVVAGLIVFKTANEQNSPNSFKDNHEIVSDYIRLWIPITRLVVYILSNETSNLPLALFLLCTITSSLINIPIDNGFHLCLSMITFAYYFSHLPIINNFYQRIKEGLDNVYQRA